ncbi:MAG: type 1 glutamine amidotransferase [Paracoccaceae bacterium]
MLIGILQTGDVPEALAPRYGEYPPMFEAWLGPAGPWLAFRAYAAHDGALPAGPGECDAWLITGSKHGVYDDLPWIAPLKAFLRAARGAGRPIVGVCFGHQILAEALGGRAVKSAKGWGAGVHDYRVVRRPGWMNGGPDSFAIHAMHQDQVTAIPDDATVLAASPFCEYAMLAYGDPEVPDAISIQPHPEFGEDYARELVTIRSGVAIPEERAAAALASFGRAVDREDFARWCVDYLRAAAARRNAA